MIHLRTNPMAHVTSVHFAIPNPFIYAIRFFIMFNVGKKYPPWGGGLCTVAVDGFADFVQ